MSDLLPIAFAAAFGGPREDVGTLVFDGVSEVALASILDLNSGSYAAKVFAISTGNEPVVTRNGLTLLARWQVDTAPEVDHVTLPAGELTPARTAARAAWEERHPDTPVALIHEHVGHGEAAYEATLRDLAEREGGTMARAAGRVMFYPVDDLELPSVRVPPLLH